MSIKDAYDEFKSFYYMNEESLIETNFTAINDYFIDVINKREERKDRKQSIKFDKIK